MQSEARAAKIHAAKRILLVEDEPTNRALLSSLLHDAGYIVDEAEDGQIAWNFLQGDKSYDVVITDRRMPNMDGLELAQKMKNVPELRGIPIIMQTAAKALGEVSEGIKAGVYYYLAKPYKEDTLITLTRSAVRDREKNNTFEQRLVRQKDAFGTIVAGEFHITSPDEAENLAFLLGSIFPRPELAVTGLYELLMNAIEHGNLKIGFEEKSRLIKSSGLEAEIKNRLASPENSNKRVVVHFANSGKGITISITDEGEGFDWKPFMEIEPSRATKSNGRGIAKANLISFDKITFSSKGNQVEITNAA